MSHLFTHRYMVKQFYLTHILHSIRYHHSGSQWIWELWQYRDTSHSSELQDSNLAIRWFNVTSKTLIREALPLCRDAAGVFYMPSWWDYTYLPTPPLGQDMTQGQFLTGFNSDFSFSYTSCLTKAEEPSLPHYLPIAGGRIIGFIPFPRVLVLCEMQSVSSRIWTRIALSISYDDNH